MGSIKEKSAILDFPLGAPSVDVNVQFTGDKGAIIAAASLHVAVVELVTVVILPYTSPVAVFVIIIPGIIGIVGADVKVMLIEAPAEAALTLEVVCCSIPVSILHIKGFVSN